MPWFRPEVKGKWKEKHANIIRKEKEQRQYHTTHLIKDQYWEIFSKRMENDFYGMRIVKIWLNDLEKAAGAVLNIERKSQNFDTLYLKKEARTYVYKKFSF